MRILYTSLLYICQPLIWLYLLLRSRKASDYRKRWLERYGFCQGKVKPGGILLHAVSLGETIAALPLIRALQQRYPDLPITVSNMTPTGTARAQQALGDQVGHTYLPYDLPGALRRFLDTVQPRMIIIMETELWPNLICQAQQRQIPILIANARLSARSAKGYARFNKTMRQLLPKIDHIAAQFPSDADRFLQLGMPPEQLSVTGNIKFDIQLSPKLQQRIASLKAEWQLTRPTWIAASTHPGEEEIILAAHKTLLKTHPDWLLILVPRHPERFKAVTYLVEEENLTYRLRSLNQAPQADTQVMIGDTLGELRLLYAMADVAFVGGSLIERGGHNPLEPALLQKPIIMGPHTFNFTAISQQLIEHGGAIEIEPEANALSDSVAALLTNPQRQQQVGQAAYQVLQANQGALERLLLLIDRMLQHERSQ